ncbi:MAG: miniconductance mechanosensitive channel [Flavobacteriaceae bacterium]|jgi:miniconductance mechanosensitive channel
MRAAIIDWIKSYYLFNGKFTEVAEKAFNADMIWWTLGLIGGLLIASIIVWYVSRVVLLQIVHAFAAKSKATWDDHLMHNKVFSGLALLTPVAFMSYFLSITFFHYPNVLNYSDKFVTVMMLFVIMTILNRFFNGLRDIFKEMPALKDKPIQSYSQILKIIFSGILMIIVLSVLTDQSPWYFLGGLGAISAILLLIFKDSILGFVGSIQLSSYDMVRVGDWVTVAHYGADGDVEEINISTVKVRNFDNTITTIPTYSFISDSFKNWRGMQESGGRRVMRSIKIQIDSVSFVTPELMARLEKIELIAQFMKERQVEIDTYNKEHGYEGVNSENGRRQTNLGLFRRYMEYALQHNEHVNQDMTVMVRQMEPTEFGLPLQVYCFTMEKNWQPYEDIVADIFDNVYATINKFDLKMYERPSGSVFEK